MTYKTLHCVHIARNGPNGSDSHGLCLKRNRVACLIVLHRRRSVELWKSPLTPLNSKGSTVQTGQTAVPRVTKWSGYCVAGEPTFGLKYLIRDEGKR